MSADADVRSRDNRSADYADCADEKLKMMQMAKSLEKDPRTYALIGAAMEVHRQLGCGFLEPVYQEAYGIELTTNGTPHMHEVELPVVYKGKELRTTYRADFICYDSIIVEVKALTKIGKIEEAQIINYLKATGYTTGLLINFGAASLEYRRFALTKSA